LTDDSDVESLTPPHEKEVEPEAPPVEEVERSPPQSPSSLYELFGAKNKIEIESQQPLSKLIKNVNHSWLDETETLSTVQSTVDSTIRHWQCYAVDEEPTINIPVPKKAKLDSVPCSFMVAQEIGGKRSNVLMRTLFDSGSQANLIHKSAIPPDVRLEALGAQQQLNTIAGQYSSSYKVPIKDIALPEFDRHRKIDGAYAFVFDTPCRYHCILGSGFLTKAGIDIKFSEKQVEWFGNTIPLRNPNDFTPEDLAVCLNSMQVDVDDDFLSEHFDEDIYDNYAVGKILDALYEKMDVSEVVKMQTHLNEQQQSQLLEVLSKYPKVFANDLGCYPHKQFHIELQPNTKPVHRRAYPVPRLHEETFKKELEHLVKIGVLSPQGSSEWGLPTFITPKKDGRVRWVSDLRELNKVIVRRVYPLPIISDVLRRRSGYEFFTKIDISMQYYSFELDDESKDLCTIVTPFGKYKYNRLPMGLKCSPDIAQEIMELTFRGVDCECYIDDVGAFSTSWEAHLKLLDQILNRLDQNNFRVNPLKCSWGVKETDWLGYWLTPTGLKPWKKKVQAILQLQRPTNATQLRSFIGAINYYRDMWPSRAGVLAPLTALSGAKKGAKITWTEECEAAFLTMKALIASDTLLAYPDHNQPFTIDTDASDYQMGAVIRQNGRPVAYWSKKLNSAQRNYTTQEKELLSIVMVLREFRSMLLGAQITIFTDHENLTFENFTSQRVLRWRLYLEDYSPTLRHKAGEKNVIADCLSRLPREEPRELEGKNVVTPVAAYVDGMLDMFFSFIDEPELMDSYLALPTLAPNQRSPLDFEWMQQQQQQDNELQQLMTRRPNEYIRRDFTDTVSLITYVKPGNDPNREWKICLTEPMLLPMVRWYHIFLGHVGQTRLLNTLNMRYHHQYLRRTITNFNCEACQFHKVGGRPYGHLGARDVDGTPWREVCVDLIGPWTVQVHGRVYEFDALTSIDPVTNLTEIIQVQEKSSEHIATKFFLSWVTRYPRPQRCVHDNGGEFIGWQFQQLLEDLGITSVPTTSRNPQANAIVERMHQTAGNILRTLVHTDPPRTVAQARLLVDEALARAQMALRCVVSTPLQATPGSLAFGRDMFLDVPYVADWQLIQQRRQQLVDEARRRINLKRRSYDYVVGQQVLKNIHAPTKLGLRKEGPYTITQVHTNGNITMELRPGVTERINIRRVSPYRTPT
jgi:transposase InsO family protein